MLCRHTPTKLAKRTNNSFIMIANCTQMQKFANTREHNKLIKRDKKKSGIH